MKRYAIIVAGGKGLRMGSDLPKQFLPIGGRPVLMHTLEAFAVALPDVSLVLVLPESQQTFWQELCREHHFMLPHDVVSGGATRFHSVLNGLRHLEGAADDAVVGVHDGVRPFVSLEVIRTCYAEAALGKAVVPVVPVVETVRELTGDGSQTRDRSHYRLVQTPQVFPLPMLSAAYSQEFRDTFTDDASVVEANGQVVELVEGNRENVKITTPFDLVVAEAVLHWRVTHFRRD